VLQHELSADGNYPPPTPGAASGTNIISSVRLRPTRQARLRDRALVFLEGRGLSPPDLPALVVLMMTETLMLDLHGLVLVKGCSHETVLL